ncbi:helix-turn-helix transcriptional regulator [Streptomyces sp. NPDC001027]|uniref:helix-turn-helix domain-containing protein n=1 Tax=Streptomyces sp. NPDC001027 TaxID=3154771 RepID=UPI00332B594B
MADFSPSKLRAHRMNVYARSDMQAMTAEELANAVGATKTQILAYENGHRVPDPPRIRALAHALNLHPWVLMNSDDREQWAIADMRRACGLRAEDVVRELGVAPKNYRRFEVEGIVPSRRPRFLDEVADVFGIPRRILELGMDHTPAVLTRLRRTREIVPALADRYVSAPGRWLGPDPADPDLLELAALYGRPLHRIRRVMTHELGELRQKQVRGLRERAIAEFDTNRERQANAELAVRRWTTIVAKDLGRIPGRLERFHRNAQPSDVWQLLVDLYNVDAADRPDGMWAVSKLVTDDTSVLPRHLVEQRVLEDIAVCRLTKAGTAHVSGFAGLYASLYPVPRRPVRPTRVTGRKTPIQASFTLPARSERLVIPQPALEELQPSSTKPNIVELGPRLVLTVWQNSLTVGPASPDTDALLPKQPNSPDDLLAPQDRR